MRASELRDTIIDSVTRQAGMDVDPAWLAAILPEIFMASQLHLVEDRWAGKPFDVPAMIRDNFVRPLFGTLMDDGSRLYTEGIIGMPRKWAKALAVDTPILTARGWATMGELREGDQVYAPDGTAARVTAVSPVFTDHPCYRFAFADRQHIVCDAGHLWTVYDQYRKREITLTAAEIAQTWSIGNRGYPERRYSVRVPGAIQTPEVELPIDPYILGAWLGDGHAADARFTMHEDDLGDFRRSVDSAGYMCGKLWTDTRRPSTATINVTASQRARDKKGSLMTLLRAAGVLNDKHIPEPYLLSSLDQRLALLQGLMDTDGTVDVGRCGETARCGFSNTNERLARGVLFLVRSLGWKASFAERRASLNGKDCGAVWVVRWTAYADDRPPFRLARKLAGLPSVRPTSRQRSRSNKITGVEHVESVPTRCISVEHESSSYLAGRGLIPTHNTTTIAGLALTFLIMEPVPGQIIGTVAKDLGQANKGLGFGKLMVEQNPYLRKLCKVYSDRIWIPDNQSTWRIFPHNADDVQGEGLRVAIMEEPHTYTRQDTIDGVRSGMGAREEPLLMGVTTAGPVRKGVLWDWIHGAVDPETGQREGGILKDPRGLYFWYGAKENEALDDRGIWRKYSPPWTTDDYLEDMFRRLTRRDFERYCLNRWPRAGRYVAAIPPDVWMSEANRRPPVFDPQRSSVVAVDAADKRDRTAVTTIQVDAEGDYNVWTEVREADRERGYHDYLALEDHLRTTAKEMNVERMAFDRRQMGRTMAELEDERYPVEEFNQDNQRMCQASQWLFELAAEGKLRHGGDPVLAKHVANAAAYPRPPLGWRFAKSDLNDPDCKIDAAISTAMAAWIAQGSGRAQTFAQTGGIWTIKSGG